MCNFQGAKEGLFDPGIIMIRVSKGDFQKFYWQIAQICFANATYEGNVDFLNDLSVSAISKHDVWERRIGARDGDYTPVASFFKFCESGHLENLIPGIRWSIKNVFVQFARRN